MTQRSLETSDTDHQETRRQILEERRPQLRRYETRKTLYFLSFLETSGTTHPKKEHHTAKDVNPQKQDCENLKCRTLSSHSE